MNAIVTEIVECSDTTLLVVGRCPYCGRSHTHGGAPAGMDWSRAMGHRVEHCDGSVGANGAGYYLVPADKIVVRQGG